MARVRARRPSTEGSGGGGPESGHELRLVAYTGSVRRFEI
ncbi:hypothetical protein Zm00014a_002258 [Zea mays]|uniref:Uncharacterized protein n=1 Tax=Zea mays TaxID=4577 RepID=A0A3L6DUS7_MAIZE|nr:hypothetical protein Zm00014a_002258 [Zea mays]